MSGWLVPSVLYILLLGGLGVTTKLALRDVTWQDVIAWTAVVYAIICITMLVSGQASLRLGAGTFWAIASAVLASTALIAFYIALGKGDASRVVPFTSATARAMAFVPFANAGISNTPIGPFHTTVFASRIMFV